MNSTENRLSERRAIDLFDRVLAPLAAARRERAAATPVAPDAAVKPASYFSPLAVRTMEARDFEFPGHGAPDGLIDALVDYWERSGEFDLCTLAPAFREIAAALLDEAVESDGAVSVFCYAMF